MGVLRDIYNRIEETASPVASGLAQSEELGEAFAVVAGIHRAVRGRVDQLAGVMWRSVNLPTATDVQRMRNQLGELDREVRLLTLQLQRNRPRAGDEVTGDGEPAGQEHD
ncbi:hypothetical protein [Flexivirga caeni]|uniref:Uncharacterized protein n=1 Tax=Flexivirga caeni TaxID=2294115 RepID=A0A3M9M2N4_9MICO|nr:hypothetical protein [Flexivirga caeni]RNI19477.1 hypothetical protein EFY87_16710 [Flexivirga caeni]